jgi:hypothetical protein
MKSVHERSDIRLHILGAAFVIAVLWHISWWSWLKPVQVQAKPPDVTLPKLSYLPLARSDGGQNVKSAQYTLWRPIIVGLPSPFGFSGPLLTRRADIKPPLDMPTDTGMFLERRISPAETSIVALPDLKYLARVRFEQFDYFETPEPVVPKVEPEVAAPEKGPEE